MKQYSLFNVETKEGADVLRLRNIKDELQPSIIAKPNEVILRYNKKIKKHVFVFKKDIAIRDTVKSFIVSALMVLTLVFTLAFMFYDAFTSGSSGYYQYKDGRVDGTGIYYEWVEGGER